MAVFKISLLLASFIYLGAAAYLIKKKLARIEKHLNNSKIIVDSKFLIIANTWWGELYRLNMASAILLFPEMFEKRGLSSPVDRSTFPGKLRAGMTAFFSLGVTIAFTCLLTTLLRLGGWVT
jgi:hypothetical protein